MQLIVQSGDKSQDQHPSQRLRNLGGVQSTGRLTQKLQCCQSCELTPAIAVLSSAPRALGQSTPSLNSLKPSLSFALLNRQLQLESLDREMQNTFNPTTPNYQKTSSGHQRALIPTHPLMRPPAHQSESAENAKQPSAMPCHGLKNPTVMDLEPIADPRTGLCILESYHILSPKWIRIMTVQTIGLNQWRPLTRRQLRLSS